MSKNHPDDETNQPPTPAGPGSKRRSRLRWIPAGLLLALLVLVAAYVALWPSMGRIAVVEEGRLYRSAELPPEKLADLCRELGIRTVVDFRKESPKTEAEAGTLQAIGVRYVPLPTEQVPGPGVVERFLSVMSDENNLPVLIHCVHGVGRTGLHAAVYRIEFQGWSNEQARWEAMLLSGFDSFQEDTPKGRFLMEYAPARGKQAPPEAGGQ